MEFETYESELADYSLQDSPFYEATTPIIFDLSVTSTANAITVNGSTSTADNILLSKKSSISSIMATKSQLLKTSFERKMIDDRSNESASSNAHSGLYGGDGDLSLKKHCDIVDGLYPIGCVNLITHDNTDNSQPKKKRKCVSFLPNYVQVSNLSNCFLFCYVRERIL